MAQKTCENLCLKLLSLILDAPWQEVLILLEGKSYRGYV